MPDIIPFKAYYYNIKIKEELESLVAPPHDVISSVEKAIYQRKNPDNIVQIILPETYFKAAQTLNEWIKSKRLIQYKAHAFYIYETKYIYNNQQLKRYGLITLVKLSDFTEKKIIPHERTFKKITEGRLNLLQETHANFNPIFFIFNGNDVYSKIIQKSIVLPPFLKTKDTDEIEHTIWIIDDTKDIHKLQNYFKNIPLVIADGHHRYISALGDLRQKGNKYIMGLIVDTKNSGLQIFPTHRLVRYVPTLNTDQILAKVNEYFKLETYNFNNSNLKEKLVQTLTKLKSMPRNAFGLLLYDKSSFFLITLKEKFSPKKLIQKDYSNTWKELDVTILHEFIFDKLLGIPHQINNSENIIYIKNLEKAIDAVQKGLYQLLFILNPTKVDQILKITASSELMPHKSTYFYPKPLSGLLIYKWD
ncbi:MAG: DUF1015 domain-containing protein [Promethearchaeota archaeon]